MKKRINKKFAAGFLTLATLCLVSAVTAGTAASQVNADSATCSFSAKSKYKEFGWDDKLGSRKIGLNKLKEVTCPDGSMINFTSAGLETVSEKETPVIQTGSSFTLNSTNITSFSMYFGNDTTSSASVTTLPITSVTATGKDGSGNISIDKPITFNDNIAILKITEEQLSTLKIGDINEISFSLEPPKVNDNYTLSFDTISFSYVEDKPTPTEVSITIDGTLETTKYSSDDKEWDTTGLNVTVVDSEGKEKLIAHDDENLVWIFDPSTPHDTKTYGEITLSISVCYKGSLVPEKPYEAQVTVSEAEEEIEKVEISGLMKTQKYLPTASSWNKQGLEVTVYYTDGTQKTFDDPDSNQLEWDINPASPSAAAIGQNTINLKVTYKEVTSSRYQQIVYIEEQGSKPVVHSMNWLVDQYQKEWSVGQAYNKSVLRVVDENDEEITDYASFTFDKTYVQITDKSVTVTVSYTNEDTTIVVTPLVKTFSVKAVESGEAIDYDTITLSGTPNVVDFSRKNDSWGDLYGLIMTGVTHDGKTIEHVERLTDSCGFTVVGGQPKSPSEVPEGTSELDLNVYGSVKYSEGELMSNVLTIHVYIYDDNPPEIASYVFEGEVEERFKHYYNDGNKFELKGLELFGLTSHGTKESVEIGEGDLTYNPSTPAEAAAAGGNVTVYYKTDKASITVSGIKYHDEKSYGTLEADGVLVQKDFTKGVDATFNTTGLTLYKVYSLEEKVAVVSTPEDPIEIVFDPLTPDSVDGEGSIDLCITFRYRGEEQPYYQTVSVTGNTKERYTVSGDFDKKTYYVGEEWDYSDITVSYYEEGKTTPSQVWTGEEALERTRVEKDWSLDVFPSRATLDTHIVSLAVSDNQKGVTCETLEIGDITVLPTDKSQNNVRTGDEIVTTNELLKNNYEFSDQALINRRFAIGKDGEENNAFIWNGKTDTKEETTTNIKKSKENPNVLVTNPTTWIQIDYQTEKDETYVKAYTGDYNDPTFLGYISCEFKAQSQGDFDDVVLSQTPQKFDGLIKAGCLNLFPVPGEEIKTELKWALTFDKNNQITFTTGDPESTTVMYELTTDYEHVVASNSLVNFCSIANNRLTNLCGTGYVSEDDWAELKEMYLEEVEYFEEDDLIALTKGYAAHNDDPYYKNYIQEFLAKYDYIVNKYGYDAFIEGRDVSPSPKINAINNTVYIIISVVAITSLAGLATLVIVKKKKEQ